MVHSLASVSIPRVTARMNWDVIAEVLRQVQYFNDDTPLGMTIPVALRPAEGDRDNQLWRQQ